MSLNGVPAETAPSETRRAARSSSLQGFMVSFPDARETRPVTTASESHSRRLGR